MGQVQEPEQVKLIAGLITAQIPLLTLVKEKMEKELGMADLSSEIFDFNYTTYYEKEMGKDLKRQFISFARLTTGDRLPEIKLFTNALENELAVEGRRMVNIDPGYITPAKLVLATTKNRSHRIYLGQGIYAEVTLVYYRGDFQPLPWTYPDYRSEGYRRFFAQVRLLYKEQLRVGNRKATL